MRDGSGRLHKRGEGGPTERPFTVREVRSLGIGWGSGGAEAVRRVFQGEVAPAEGAVMVGDSPFDLQSGLSAGTRAVGVTWGFFARDQLEGVGAHAIVDSVGALRAELLPA